MSKTIKALRLITSIVRLHVLPCQCIFEIGRQSKKPWANGTDAIHGWVKKLVPPIFFIFLKGVTRLLTTSRKKCLSKTAPSYMIVVVPIIAHPWNFSPPLWYICHVGYLTTKLGGGGYNGKEPMKPAVGAVVSNTRKLPQPPKVLSVMYFMTTEKNEPVKRFWHFVPKFCYLIAHESPWQTTA